MAHLLEADIGLPNLNLRLPSLHWGPLELKVSEMVTHKALGRCLGFLDAF